VQSVSDRPFYSKIIPAHSAAPVEIKVTHLSPGAAYRLEIHRTGYHTNDAYSAYLEMGSPTDLTPPEIAHLDYLTRDAPETDRTVSATASGAVTIDVPMSSNDIVLVTLHPGN
jgi:xylan 1,4-beta-xylosidase